MTKKALVQIGAGKKAHMATFQSLHRYSMLLDDRNSNTVFTHCQVLGKAKVAPGEIELCKNCFPYTSSPSAYEYRQRHQAVL